MLIICYDAWVSNVQPLADHKTAIGIPATVVPVSEAGSSGSAIKSYIQDVYDSGDLAFVLLVGDHTQVPSMQLGYALSDPSYSKLAGGDDWPDIIVGRLSAEEPEDVDVQVLKSVEHEELAATEEDWFWKATGIGSAQGAGYGDDGESDKEHQENLRQLLLAHGYTEVDQVYDPGASASMVSAGLNAGRGMVNYTGHGGPTGWSTTGFSNSHVNQLVNDNMLPVITSVACNTGQFDAGTCLASTARPSASPGPRPCRCRTSTSTCTPIRTSPTSPTAGCASPAPAR